MPPTRAKPAPAVLDTNQAAAYLSVAKQTLENWRTLGQGPRYVRFGTGARAAIRYKIADLDQYIEACAVGRAAA